MSYNCSLHHVSHYLHLSLCISGVQLALAEAQSQLPHTARAGVNGIILKDEDEVLTGAEQRRAIEDLLVTILIH